MADAAAVAPEHQNFGIQDLWDSGPVSKVLLTILVVMSLYSWYVLIVKLLDQNALNKYASTVDKDFWGASSIADGIARLKGGDDIVPEPIPEFTPRTGQREVCLQKRPEWREIKRGRCCHSARASSTGSRA